MAKLLAQSVGFSREAKAAEVLKTLDILWERDTSGGSGYRLDDSELEMLCGGGLVIPPTRLLSVGHLVVLASSFHPAPASLPPLNTHNRRSPVHLAGAAQPVRHPSAPGSQHNKGH